jgi:hypothetical protein
MATFTLMVERDADGDWRLFLPDASGFEESRGIVYLGAPDQPVVAARLKPDGGPRLNVLQALTVEDFRLAAQIVSEDQQFCEQTERDPRDLDRIASVLAEAGRDHPARYVDPLSKGEAGADV